MQLRKMRLELVIIFYSELQFMYVQQNIFEKTPIKVCSSHLYASFGTFCVQIGHLFEVQRVFEKCMNTVKSLFSKEYDVDFEIFRKFKV